jgi:peptide methionine sulfoxide reductase MsrB
MKNYFILLLFLLISSNSFGQSPEIDYFKKLNSKEKNVIVNKGTEYPFTGEYDKHFELGVYHCKACDTPLYHSAFKFKSNCGWPSFDNEIKGAIKRN